MPDARPANGARFDADGSCSFVDDIVGTDVVWESVHQWAAGWIAEWRAEERGAACEFIAAACDDAAPGVVAALVALAEAADGDASVLSWVGAGPLEDLVSHSGNGARCLAEVDRAARQSPAFRAALRNTWIGADVPAPVRKRLGELGAIVLRRG